MPSLFESWNEAGQIWYPTASFHQELSLVIVSSQLIVDEIWSFSLASHAQLDKVQIEGVYIC
jgi:hypothetical protein